MSTHKKEQLTPAHIQEKLMALKPTLLQGYPLSYLAFTIVTRQAIDHTVAKGEEVILGEWTELYIIVDFKEAVGWQFYKLQATLIDYLQTEVSLITKTSPDRGWISKQTKPYEII
ncbi:hypothetical protein BKI52_00350 [marine bacterium AO1-C]|nr:hypothetical protein BKI52_00350 [marine bacterium AO1-C]